MMYPKFRTSVVRCIQRIWLLLLLLTALTGPRATQGQTTSGITTGAVTTLPNNVITGKKVGDSVYLPTSQLVRPSGRNKMITGRPVELAIDSARRKIAVLNSQEIDILDSQTDQLLATTIKTRATSYGGIAT
jgi:hypothetical protein